MNVIKVKTSANHDLDRREMCRHLEHGDILLLTETPFLPPQEDCELLRTGQQSGDSAHKNIAYKPNLRRTTRVDESRPDLAERINDVMARYSAGAIAFLADLFPAYSSAWRIDYASFRPLEEQGRSLPLKRRNDLMHVDAFPTRPTNGDRILRAFTNLNVDRPRVWSVSDSFAEVADKYAIDAGLRGTVGRWAAMRRSATHVAHKIGVPIPDRSAYDEFMLGFHHYLKSNEEFQRTGGQHTISFAPGETWISFTDQIAHAVRSGQYALEQTFIVSHSTLLEPELAPLAVLERLAGVPLVRRAGARNEGSNEMNRAPAN